MSTVVVVQARMGSTRLPGKVARPFGGRPMLSYQLDRLVGMHGPTDTSVVVATSDLDRDDAVAEIAATAGVDCVRGSETDVLARFGAVLERYSPTHVVRLTGDCPFSDPAVVHAVFERHIEAAADYTSNVFPRTFPRGLDVEVARSDALRTAITEAHDPVEREHVMPFLYRRPDRFRLAALTSDGQLGHLSWVVDTAEDFAYAEGIAARFAPRGDQSWAEILACTETTERPGPEPHGLQLRPAGADDAEFVRVLRNDADAVRTSRSGSEVGVAEHVRWFAARLVDPACRLWIVTRDGQDVGQLRVDVHDVGVGTISIAVTRGARGQGVARGALQVLQTLVSGDPQIVRLVAAVHTENVASRTVFEHVGFTTVGEDDGFLHYGWPQAGTVGDRNSS